MSWLKVNPPGSFGPSMNNFYWLVVKILTLEIIEHKLYQNVKGTLSIHSNLVSSDI